MNARDLALDIARLGEEKLAEGIVVIDIGKLSSVADYLVIMSADSDRQVEAIAENIQEGLKAAGETPIGVEGVSEGRWALIDYVDVVAHVFLAPVREHYDIEGLWADAPRVPLDGGGSEGGAAGSKGPAGE